MSIIIIVFLVFVLFFEIKIIIELYTLKRFLEKKKLENKALNLEEEIDRIIKYDFSK